MAPVRHRWSINDVIGGIRNTVIPSDCSPRLNEITITMLTKLFQGSALKVTGINLNQFQCSCQRNECSAERYLCSWLFNVAVATTRLISVDGIGNSEMVFGETRHSSPRAAEEMWLVIRLTLALSSSGLKKKEGRRREGEVASQLTSDVSTVSLRCANSTSRENPQRVETKTSTLYTAVICKSVLQGRLFSVDEIGDSEMRPRIRRRLPCIHITLGGKPRKKPNQDSTAAAVFLCQSSKAFSLVRLQSSTPSCACPPLLRCPKFFLVYLFLFFLEISTVRSETFNVIRKMYCNLKTLTIATRLSLYDRTRIAARMEVWQSPSMVQRWWRMVKGRNATLDYKIIKRLHVNFDSHWLRRVLGTKNSDDKGGQSSRYWGFPEKS
ncbi:hypothetical protein ANN_23287 [Periplaneta americana]|uniref:Uncharacterized protein n=1 Tax=Periplaneta americana TaxID=6978 RepID=A0ABQ8SLK7_PERAM|nr:hypothetical protein ANN_23287 [Periplaneta americana]